MFNKKYLLICSIALCIILCSMFVSATTFEQGIDVDLKIPCENLNCSSTNNITIVYPNSTIAVNNDEMSISNGYANYTFSLNDVSGDYQYFIYDTDGGYFSGSFLITPNGITVSEGNAFIYIGLLLVFVIFLIGAVVIFMETENLLARVGMFGLGYLLLIAITFISWNMASDFLLSAPFIASMFRILFFVLTIALFPLIIGAFAYYFIMLSKIKEIERLMEKGVPYYDASRRSR